MLFGRAVPVPPAILAALERVLGERVDYVRLVEHSRFARVHDCDHATTRRRRIYLRGSAADFFANPELMLHEYFHVVKQWEPRRLTTWRYLRESVRQGYWNNGYEIEARVFAKEHRGQLEAALNAPYPNSASRS